MVSSIPQALPITCTPLPPHPTPQTKPFPLTTAFPPLPSSQHEEPHTFHARLLKSGLLPGLYTSNTLIHRYAKSGHIFDARRVFDEMPQWNLVSWTSLLSGYSRLGMSEEAFQVFLEMVESGCSPNEFAFGSVLRACGECGDVRLGAQVHGLVVKMGLVGNAFAGCGLVSMYAKGGEFDASLRALVGLDERDEFGWTSVITGYSNVGRCVDALGVFVDMLEDDVRPSEYTLTSVLKACSCLEGWCSEGLQVHGYVVKAGLKDEIPVCVSLVNLYAKLGDITSAERIYDSACSYNVVLCTAMIGGYAQTGKPEKGILTFLDMYAEKGIPPNEFTFANVLSACAVTGDLRIGSCFHAFVLKTHFACAKHVQGALIDVYAKAGDMKAACLVFEKMGEKDEVSCSSIVSGFSYNGLDHGALEFYTMLDQSSIKPDPFAVASVMISCAKLADQLRGRQVHAQVIKCGYERDVCITSALVDMYAKSGSLVDAETVFEELSVRDRIAWTAMIDGYAQHGKGRQALDLFEKMREEDVVPNGITFVSILHACSHAGLVEEGLEYFNLMRSNYGIEPVIHHYACVIDLLGRSNRLTEALELVNNMPLEPTVLVWRSLLAACKVHKNLEIGIYAAKQLLELDPLDDATYVLLANMYSSAGMWSEASRVRINMKSRGVKKVPGLSWVGVGKSFHVFGAGDTSHSQKEQIYEFIKKLNPEMKKVGYDPETEFALCDASSEERERMLQYHSERLAVAYGLISTPSDSCIKIYKNLRICGDCHNAMKAISLICKRTIILRDVSRFHHFTEGQCSCGDYW